MANREVRDRRKKAEARRQRGQFILLVLFSAAVLLFAISTAISITQNRIKDTQAQENEINLKAVIDEIAAQQEKTQQQLDEEAAMDYWPDDSFPSVPLFEASRYKTTARDMYAVVQIPAEEAGRLEEYIEAMVAAGASVYVRTVDLTVLLQAGTEMHIQPTGPRPTITLCGEPQISWRDEAYPEVILPAGGKLVSARDEADALVFTYRQSAIGDAQDYLSLLRENGWASDKKVVAKDNTLYVTYTKGDWRVDVDYFSKGSDYLITFAKPGK